MSEFSWYPPSAAIGDRVEFMTHTGRLAQGIVRHVETTYGFRGPGAAVHTYAVEPDGHRRRQWVNDAAIVRVLNQQR